MHRARRRRWLRRKIFVYPEHCWSAWLSRKLGRPVKWIETPPARATCHDPAGRDHITDFEVAAQSRGRVTGIRVKTLGQPRRLPLHDRRRHPDDALRPHGRPASYDIPNIYVKVIGVYTNTALVDAYRGAGRPEATYLIERIMDLVAREIGMDPVEVRRKNFIPSDDVPVRHRPRHAARTTPATTRQALDKALEIVDYDELPHAAGAKRDSGDGKLPRHRLLHLRRDLRPRAVAVDRPARAGARRSSRAPTSSVHLTGKVVVTTGSMPHGQGHETTFAQVVADELGVPVRGCPDRASATRSERRSATAPTARARWPSAARRSSRSANKIIEKAKKLAAHMLEVGERGHRVRRRQVRASRAAPDSAKTIQEIALAASVGYNLPEGMEPCLDETTYYDPPNATFPFGTHIAVVEVDAETGKVELEALRRGGRLRQRRSTR